MSLRMSLAEVSNGSEARLFKNQFRFGEESVLSPTPKPSDSAQVDPRFRVANRPNLRLWRLAVNDVGKLRPLDEFKALGFHNSPLPGDAPL